MATTPIGGVLEVLQSVGFFRYILPFLLTFTVVYGVLKNIEVFGGDLNNEDQLYAVIAVVFAFFVMLYTPVSQSLVVFLSNLFGAWALVLIFLLMGLTGIGLATGSQPSGGWQRAFTWVGGLSVVFLFIYWGGLQMIAPSITFPQGDFIGVMTTRDVIAALAVLFGVLAVAYVLELVPRGNGNGAPEPEEENV